MGRPPLGPLATPRQFAGRPGPDAKKIAEARTSADRDRQAFAAKMRAEFAKRSEAIKKKAGDAAKSADREKAAQARREAGEKKERAEKAKKAQEKK